MSNTTNLAQKDCVKGDWYGNGPRDAMAGYENSKVHSHRQECSEHGVRVDLNRYEQGHRKGLMQFCTRANGYKQGSKGWSFKEVCPDKLKADFLEGYTAGISNALERAELELRPAKWRHRQKKHLLKNEKSEKKRKKLSESLSRLEREVERRFKEVQQLQKLQNKADFLYRKH